MIPYQRSQEKDATFVGELDTRFWARGPGRQRVSNGCQKPQGKDTDDTACGHRFHFAPGVSFLTISSRTAPGRSRRSVARNSRSRRLPASVHATRSRFPAIAGSSDGSMAPRRLYRRRVDDPLLLNSQRAHGRNRRRADRRNHGRDERADRERACSHRQRYRVPG